MKQPETRHNGSFPYFLFMNHSIDIWQQAVLDNSDRAEDIHDALYDEVPSMVCGVFERTCNLQCTHCLFQEEQSSLGQSLRNNYQECAENLILQTPSDGPESPAFLHEGRIVSPWHIDLFQTIQAERPDISRGLIDNGSYTRLIEQFKEKDVTLDWMDISIDGVEENHNKNRDPIEQESFDEALNGLKRAREIVEGRVTSLMTLQTINYADVPDVADVLFQTNPEHPSHDLADEMHITFMVPHLRRNHAIDIEQRHMNKIWTDVKQTVHQHRGRTDKVFFKVYGHHHLELLAEAIGNKKFLDALEDAETKPGTIIPNIEGVPIHIYPYSIFLQECLFLDADSTQRVAHSQSMTLQELHRPENQDYTVQRLTPDLDYESAHDNAVEHWWSNFGKSYLEREKTALRNIKEKAVEEHQTVKTAPV